MDKLCKPFGVSVEADAVLVTIALLRGACSSSFLSSAVMMLPSHSRERALPRSSERVVRLSEMVPVLVRPRRRARGTTCCLVKT